MIRENEQFDAFTKAYIAWDSRTQVLPFRRDLDLLKGAFELDLDHLIDYVRPILTAAAKRSTQFDYPRVASEYLHDLDQIETELASASLGEADRQTYFEYCSQCRRLLSELSLLPVPAEGHLAFRGSALHAFRFLLHEYDFKVAETSPTSVRFTNDTTFVDVSHWPGFPMNSILVGRRTDAETATSGFGLDDFAYVAGLGVLFDYERFDLLDPAGIAKFLQTAASVVRGSGDLLLRGDAEGFRDFQGKADEREGAYIEMMERQPSANNDSAGQELAQRDNLP